MGDTIMAYGTLLTDAVQSSTANTPPQFNDGNGTQVGTLCRAWVNFNGVTTATIRASFNVSSVTRTAMGRYTINLTNALSDSIYSANVSTSTDATAAPCSMVTQVSSSSLTVSTNNSAGTAVDQQYINIAIFR